MTLFELITRLSERGVGINRLSFIPQNFLAPMVVHDIVSLEGKELRYRVRGSKKSLIASRALKETKVGITKVAQSRGRSRLGVLRRVNIGLIRSL